MPPPKKAAPRSKAAPAAAPKQKNTAPAAPRAHTKKVGDFMVDYKPSYGPRSARTYRCARRARAKLERKGR